MTWIPPPARARKGLGLPEIPADIPVYAYIKRELKIQIENGELAEGARLPSELQLAREYNVSRNPTRQALRDL